jgi:hypothetical protein
MLPDVPEPEVVAPAVAPPEAALPVVPPDEPVSVAVPDAVVPPVVRLGTWPDKLGTCAGKLGTAPGRLGTWLGKAGTAGTVGPAVVVPAGDPTGGVMTVVAPDGSVGGMTTAVLAVPELLAPEEVPGL